MNDRPLVSIALSVYNGATTLEAAIASIMQQTYTNWELIIIDDASSDSSLQVARKFKDDRIQIIPGDTNLGLSARLNMAMDLARGKYFARMDQDDISYPQRLQVQIDFLENHKEIDLLAAQTLFFLNDGSSVGKLKVSNQHQDICKSAWNGFYMPHPTWMGRIEWFRKYRYVSEADGVEDQHLLYRSYPDSRFACLEMPLLGYRILPPRLKTLLKKRKLFARSFARVAIQNKRYSEAILIVFVQMIKAIADCVNSLRAGEWYKRILRRSQLSDSEKDTWKHIWQKLNAD